MKSKGFTLVEVLIGLSIATVAAVSVAYTIASTNKVTDAGTKLFIATNLAHQGLELALAMRDNAWLADGAAINHTDWVTRYGICGDSADENHQFDLNADAIGMSISDLPDGFTRTLVADCVNQSSDPAYVTITSRIDWTAPNGDAKNLELKERLYNWYIAPTPKP